MKLTLALTAALTLPLLAVDHHVTTAQEFQNALTTAAANAADDTIYLAARLVGARNLRRIGYF